MSAEEWPMIDPTHPDVVPVLDLLDPCDVCNGSARPRACDNYADRTCGSACRGCNGTGKALHPDRAVGALRRWLESHDAQPRIVQLAARRTAVLLLGNAGMFVIAPDERESEALAYCLAAAYVSEQLTSPPE